MTRLRRARRGRSFAERNQVLLGITGSATVLIVLLLALNVSSLPFIGGGRSFRANFSDAGGLNAGDHVELAGFEVGSVDAVRLAGDHVQVAFTVTDDDVVLGARTSARIVTVDVLGKKALEVQPAGPGRLPGGEIPLARTTSPYDITDALSRLTSTTQQIDVQRVATALDVISSTFRGTPTVLRSALRGVSEVSATIANRDDELQALLASTKSISAVLASRNREVGLLLTDGTELLAELNARHAAIVALLADTSAVSRQFTGLVADQRRRLGPALRQLTTVVRLLNRNQRNIEAAISVIGPYATALGEALGSGPFFDAYVQNLTNPLALPLYPSILTGLGK